MEVLSGWLERERGKDHVRLVYRDEEGAVRSRRFSARWSFFVSGLDDDDRRELQRLSAVQGVSDAGSYVRVDCTSRWDRTKLVRRIEEIIEGAKISGPVASEVCEGDVGPLRRLLSDVSALRVSIDHRACYLDLEVDSRKSMERQRGGHARVLSWCLAWERDGEVRHVAALLGEDSDESERALLQRLLAALERFDLVLAWFGAIYDFEVFTRRAVKLDARLPSGRFPEWNRWCWLDHAEVFRKYNMSAAGSGDEKASMSLQSVAERIVGEGKHDFDASRTWEAWEAGGEERRRMLRYCVQDTRLLPMIERETGYVELHREVCRICNVLPHTSSLKATQQGDGYLLRLGEERDHRWPTLHHDEEPGEAFEGAWVLEPTRTGAIDDVSVADFAGLYPSIMRSWNMSPETEVAPYLAKRLAARGVALARLPARRTLFRVDVRGLIPEALDDLQAKRDSYKAEMTGYAPGSPEWKRAFNLSAAFKIVINSFYGIVGSPWSRFYNKAVAEGVTTTGSWLLKHVAMRAREAGLDPFYGDTDSIFVVGDPARFAVVVAELNQEWPSLLRDLGAPRCHIELDYEKRFRRMILVSAKRYAATLAWYKGVDADPDAKPEVKGLEYKRGDSLRIARRMQEELIGMLLRPGDVPGTEELAEFVERWKAVVYGGGVTLEDLVLSQGVKRLDEYAERYTTARCPKPCGHDFGAASIAEGPKECGSCGTPRKIAAQPPHVRVAKAMVEAGEQVNPGDRIRYFVRRSEGSGMDAVPASDVESVGELDLDYYWLSRILPPSARVLEVVHPQAPWTPTAASRREEEKERLIEERRGRVDDLPLFGAPFEPGPEPLGPAPRIRRGKRKDRDQRQSSPPECVVTFVGGPDTTPLHLRAAKAAAEAHPGPLPLVVMIDVADEVGVKGATVRIPTGMAVARSARLREAFENLGARVTGLPGGR